MKFLKTISIFIVVISTSINSQAQGLAIGIGGGVNSVQSPDHFTNSVNGGGFGMGLEYLIGMKLKIDIPVQQLRPIVSLYYGDLNGEGNLDGNSVEYSTSLFTLGAGVEWTLLPGPVSGFIAFDIFIASFGKLGKTTNGSKEVLDNVGFSRNGIGLGIGLETTLTPKFSLDAVIKYQLNNMLGKYDISDEIWFGGEEETMSTINITVNILYNI